MGHDLPDVGIARGREACPEGIEVEALAARKGEAVGRDMAPGRQALQQGLGRDHDDAASHVRQGFQGLQPLGHDVRVWRERVVRQGLVAGQGTDRQFAVRIEGHFRLQAGRVAARAGDQQDRGAGCSGEFGHGQRQG